MLSLRRQFSPLSIALALGVLGALPAGAQIYQDHGYTNTYQTPFSQAGQSCNFQSFSGAPQGCGGSMLGYTYGSSGQSTGYRAQTASSISGSGSLAQITSTAYGVFIGSPEFFGTTPYQVTVYYRSIMSVSSARPAGSPSGPAVSDARAHTALLYSGDIQNGNVFDYANNFDGVDSPTLTSTGTVRRVGDVLEATFRYSANEQLFFEAFAQSELYDLTAANNALGTASSSASIDFLGVQALDAQGNALADQGTCTFANSTTSCAYSGESALSTPEPTSMVLLGTGLSALIFVRRRSRIGEQVRDKA